MESIRQFQRRLYPDYWRVIDSVWDTLSIDDGPETFLKQFRAIPPEAGHLLAATWCSSEARNGGFRQFFWNSTGMLAPEAVDGFQAIGMYELADVLKEAMQFFGKTYPRDRKERQEKLADVPLESRAGGNVFEELNQRFYAWLSVEKVGRFERVADEYAKSVARADEPLGDQ